MTFGYARVSTLAQNLDAQVDTLVGAGGDERCVVVEHGSGQRDERTALSSRLDSLRPDDTLVVTRLDRLGRSAAHIAQLVATPRTPRRAALALGDDRHHDCFRAGHGSRSRIRARTRPGRGRPTVMTPQRVDAARAALAQGQSMTAIAVIHDTLYRNRELLRTTH